jgi:flagellar biosynthesis chaperone FliJ
MRERKTYEKLRERAWERYRMDEGREEIRVVDDIATISLERIRTGEAGEIYEG